MDPSDQQQIDRIRCFLLDMDGTLYLGGRWIDGARAFLDAVRRTGRTYCFLTNNSSRTTAGYVQKLAAMGLDIDPETELVTSTRATVDYLRRAHPGRRVYLLGTAALRQEFLSSGIAVDEQNPDLVVAAYDTELTYQKLCAVCDLLRAGLPFVATHPDLNCPTETGFVPDLGAFCALIEASTGRKPDIVIGKPNRAILDCAMAVTGSAPAATAVVGDRLYTDIASAVRIGMCGILVLSGETRAADVAASPDPPTLIFDSVAEITPYLR